MRELVKDILKTREKDGGINSVVWIAAGGSYGGFYPAQYFMDREATGIRSQSFTSNEFVFAPPKFCGPNTLAVICSMRGTPETCEAARIAKRMGAVTLGLYVQESDLTEICDYRIQYQSIALDDSKQDNVNSSIGLKLAMTLVDEVEGYGGYDDAMDGFRILDDIYRKAVDYATPLAKRWAEDNKDKDTIYVMGSGPAMGSAYIFSICNIMEMPVSYTHLMDYDRNSQWNLATDEFPATEKVLTDPNYTEAEYWPAFIEQIPYTRARDVTPKWPEISVGYQTALQNALTLKQTPEEAVKEGQKIIDEALAK